MATSAQYPIRTAVNLTAHNAQMDVQHGKVEVVIRATSTTAVSALKIVINISDNK